MCPIVPVAKNIYGIDMLTCFGDDIYTYIYIYIYRIYYYLRMTLTHYIEETPINIYEGAMALFTHNYRKGRRFEISKMRSRNNGLAIVQCMNDTLS